jgi:hypothetical protein
MLARRGSPVDTTYDLLTAAGHARNDNLLCSVLVVLRCAVQVMAACFERCIGTERRAEPALRADLAEWVGLTTSTALSASASSAAAGEAAPTAAPSRRGAAGRVRAPAAVPVPNMQNRRLALMALHTVRNLKTSPFGAPYKALFSDLQ